MNLIILFFFKLVFAFFLILLFLLVYNNIIFFFFGQFPHLFAFFRGINLFKGLSNSKRTSNTTNIFTYTLFLLLFLSIVYYYSFAFINNTIFFEDYTDILTSFQLEQESHQKDLYKRYVDWFLSENRFVFGADEDILSIMFPSAETQTTTKYLTPQPSSWFTLLFNQQNSLFYYFPLLILYFPLVSFLICCLFGFYIGHNGSSVISTLFIFITFLISLFCFFYMLSVSNSWYIHLGTWFQVDILEVNYGFIFDSLSITMSVVVSLISFLVHLYSINYMKLDPSRSRFMGYLSMFTFFMFVLIFSDNFVLFFFGWEGIGLSSYLLIGFWFTRIQANKSAIKALFINRIGDFFLLLGVVFIFLLYGSVDFLVVFTLTPFYQQIFLSFFGYQINMIFFITILLFLAAVGKSAQIFLHTWLPDAMEGPTPVSALIHAATMVTAGIFLILRTSAIFEYASPYISEILVWFGLLTVLLSSLAGSSQFDIKKIIAYSTCSQLGYMVLICGFSEYAMAFYHLVNHAFFKALLFLAAGSVIHSLANEQDIRRMGGLLNTLPLTYSSFIVGSLALCGFPFLSGFFSKDPIVLVLYHSVSLKNFFIFLIILFSNTLTCFYSFRLIYYVFLSSPNGNEKIYSSITEDTNFFVIFPFLILSFLSITSGFFLEDMFIGIGSDLFDTSLITLPVNAKLDYEFIVPFHVQMLSILISFMGLFFIFFFKFFDSEIFFLNFYNRKIKIFKIIFKRFYRMSREKNHFNSIYNRIIAITFLEKFNLFFKNIDANLLEIFGPLSINEFFDKISFGLEKNTKDSFFFFLSIFIAALVYICLIFILI